MRMVAPLETLREKMSTIRRSDSFANDFYRLGSALAYFATEYTIHFDDTMAYGSHHFLTAFRFQCAARESLLFGERVFDVAGVRDALDHIHLLTADAYARNLNPARLGDRVAILLTLEDWARASARFCYRVISAQGQPICAGFQTLICADSLGGSPIPLPPPLREALEGLREIEELKTRESFRDRVLAGGTKVDSLFGDAERQTAIQYLVERYPSPKVIPAVAVPDKATRPKEVDEASGTVTSPEAAVEAWVFSGQGAFNPALLSERVVGYTKTQASARYELDQCAAVAQELIGGKASALVSGSSDLCRDAVRATPELSQVAIHLQNVLGALLRKSQGYRPSIVMGHSFGEIAALGVAGCFDLPTGVRVVCERVRAVAAYAAPDGGLLAVSTDRQAVATETALLGLDQVVIAGRNHEKQTIVSGPCDQLEQLREYLRRIAIDAVTVPSPTSFHHPQLCLAAKEWLKQLRALPLTGPRLPVYSPIGRRFISPDDDIASILASQFLRPFDLQGGILDVIAAGANRFVDCGSTGSLARLIVEAGPDALEVLKIDTDVAHQLARCSPPKPANPCPLAPATVHTAATADTRFSQTDETTDAHRGRRVVPRVAIVGQGCILPGGASSPEALLAAISERRTGIVDQRRFDPHWSEDFYSEKLVPDRSTSHLTGRLDDAQIVVPQGVDPSVFAEFSRAQRLLCIALTPCVPALASADRVLCLIGATADGFENQDDVTALHFAGVDPTDQRVDQRMHTARSAFQGPHDAVQEVFDRVVRPGIKVTLIDAACASSLYTVALGMQAIELDQADAVIAGGVFCPGPGNSCLFSQFQGTTSTGCRPFDAKADGVVFSEGAAFVTLRRVSDAERMGLPISAVVRGVGLSSDGRSSSANVPQTTGQLLSLERCYANYGIDRASIQAVEAHGTSTPVGDSTELQTLRQFFQGHTTKPIPIHSLKGLLGHAGWAAGAASIIAVSEYLRVGLFPAQAFHREPSKALLDCSSTLTVPSCPVPLLSQTRRIAIDGFGFGGANAHLVLDHYSPAETAREDSSILKTGPKGTASDLVCVAYCQLLPSLSTSEGPQFDRDRVKLQAEHTLLPDLADDMDVSQTIAILLMDQIVQQIPQFDDGMRSETSIVLAHSGNTERAVEATLRVLAPRLRRNLAGLDDVNEAINAAVDRAALRPLHAAMHDAQRGGGSGGIATQFEWTQLRRRFRLRFP